MLSVKTLLDVGSCRGIPIPGGKDDSYSLAGVVPRLADLGIKTITTAKLLAMGAVQWIGSHIPSPEGINDPIVVSSLNPPDRIAGR